MGCCCCPLFDSWVLVPPCHHDLSAEELQELYVLSTQLNNGRLIVQGLFARAGARNTNGRVYPSAILRPEVARFRAQHVARGSALGELNHPSYYSSYFRSLNLPNVSHQVLELRWRGQELWGTIEVLPTPAGLLLSELYSKGIKLGVSSRGWASVATDPASAQVVVEPDYQLITFDFVPEPSNAGAYVVPIAKRYRRRLPDQSAAVAISYLGIGSCSMSQLEQLPPASTLRRWLKYTSRAMDAAAKHPGRVAVQAMAAGITVPGQALLQPPAPCAASAPGEQAQRNLSAHACSRSSSSSSASYSYTAGVSMLGALSGLAGGQQVLPPDTPLGGGVVLGCHYQVLDKPWLPVDAAVRAFKVHLSLMATQARLHQHQQQDARQAAPQHQQQQQQRDSRNRVVQQPAEGQPHQQPLLPMPRSDTSGSSSSLVGQQQQQQQEQSQKQEQQAQQQQQEEGQPSEPCQLAGHASSLGLVRVQCGGNHDGEASDDSIGPPGPPA